MALSVHAKAVEQGIEGDEGRKQMRADDFLDTAAVHIFSALLGKLEAPEPAPAEFGRLAKQAWDAACVLEDYRDRTHAVSDRNAHNRSN